MIPLILSGLLLLAGEPVVISPADPASLQRGLDAAVKAGDAKIVIPPGTYRLAPRGDTCLRLSGVKDLVIDATGVTLLRTEPSRAGVVLDNCQRVTLRGLTLLNENLPFTQGTIVGVDEQFKWLDVQVHAGYPEPLLGRPGTAYVFDPATRQWKAGSYDLAAKSIEQLADGRFRLTYDRPVRFFAGPVRAGDLLAMRRNGTSDLRVYGCADCRIEDVTIQSGSGFCIHENGGEGRNWYRYQVTYGPPPAGATERPLIACLADAFHSSGVRHGPTLDGCRFEGMPDDGVPIHGHYGMVMARTGADVVIALPWDRNIFEPRDPLRLFAFKGPSKGEAKVVASAAAPDYKPAQPITQFRFKDVRKFWRLTLDHELPAEAGDLVSNPADCGAGFVVRHCVIRNHRARGMLIKADDGLIEDNLIDGSTIAGIVVAPEFWWNEACYSHRLVIRNNTIRHCAYATTGPWSEQVGGICLNGEGAIDGHQQVVIENNTIEDIDGINLRVSDATGVVVRRNRFLNTQQRPSRTGADRKLDSTALVLLDHCRQVELSGNTVTGRGAGGGPLLVLGPDATSIVGAPGGVTEQRGN